MSILAAHHVGLRWALRCTVCTTGFRVQFHARSPEFSSKRAELIHQAHGLLQHLQVRKRCGRLARPPPLEDSERPVCSAAALLGGRFK
jgi:hypothetical protein